MDLGFAQYSRAKQAQQSGDLERAHSLYITSVGTFMAVLERHRTAENDPRMQRIEALVRSEAAAIMDKAEECKRERDAQRQRQEGGQRCRSLARAAAQRRAAADVALTAALNNSGALLALETLTLEEIPASGAAKEAVQSALTWLPNVLPRVRRRVRV